MGEKKLLMIRFKKDETIVVILRMTLTRGGGGFTTKGGFYKISPIVFSRM